MAWGKREVINAAGVRLRTQKNPLMRMQLIFDILPILSGNLKFTPVRGNDIAAAAGAAVN